MNKDSNKSRKSRESGIFKEEENAIGQAKADYQQEVNSVHQVEKEISLRALNAVDELKKQLGKAKDKQEKKALKQAIKEAQSAARDTIRRAKNNTQAQVKAAWKRRQEAIAQAKTQPKLEIQKPEKADNIPELVLQTPVATDHVPEISDWLQPALDETEQPLPVEETEPEAGKYSGYEDIRRALEEVMNKLEQKKTDSLVPDVDEAGIFASSVEQISQQQSVQADYLETPEETPSVFQQQPPELASTITNAVAPSLTREESGSQELFEGRVTIAIQHPVPAASLKLLGNTLKKTDGLKLLLFGGSVDGGAQLVVMLQEPIPLIARIREAMPVEIVSVSEGEIRLKL